MIISGMVWLHVSLYEYERHLCRLRYVQCTIKKCNNLYLGISVAVFLSLVDLNTKNLFGLPLPLHSNAEM